MKCVFKASCPFVCTLMWCVKKLVHYLLLRRSRFNMHQLLCMKRLLRETGLMIIFICAPPGIFNSISLLNKRDRLWAQTEMWYETRRSDSDNRRFSSGVWRRCFWSALHRPWPLTFSESALMFSCPFLWYGKISLF